MNEVDHKFNSVNLINFRIGWIVSETIWMCTETCSETCSIFSTSSKTTTFVTDLPNTPLKKDIARIRHIQEIYNPVLLWICMYYPACLWCFGQVWNYAGQLPSIATGNLSSKVKKKKKSVACRCQGFHCEASAAPSRINKICRNRSLQRLLRWLRGIAGCWGCQVESTVAQAPFSSRGK